MINKFGPARSGWGRRWLAAGLASVMLVSSGCCVAFCRPNTCDNTMECKVFKPLGWLNIFHCKKHHQQQGMPCECAMPCEASMPVGDCCSGDCGAPVMAAPPVMMNPQMQMMSPQFVPAPQGIPTAPGAMVPAQ